MSLFSCKVVFIGNSGVGKTSIVNYWINETFNSSIRSTIGANHQRKKFEFEDKIIDMFVWDTAGQEQYYSLAPLYARSASVAIATVSITDLNSINSVDFWISNIKESCEILPPIILVVNKIDLIQDYVLTQNEIENLFSNKYNGIIFCSAKTGEGIENIFEFAARLGYNFLKSNNENTIINKPEISEASENSKCCN